RARKGIPLDRGEDGREVRAGPPQPHSRSRRAPQRRRRTGAIMNALSQECREHGSAGVCRDHHGPFLSLLVTIFRQIGCFTDYKYSEGISKLPTETWYIPCFELDHEIGVCELCGQAEAWPEAGGPGAGQRVRHRTHAEAARDPAS